jgi:TRAP transporter TAXI family solute receptor
MNPKLAAPELLRRHLPTNIGGRDLGWYVLGVLVLLALLGWALVQLAPPPPPKRVVMTTGAPDGAYHKYAELYRAKLAAAGVELELRPSSGALQNLERLRTGENGVEVGLVQGGLVAASDADQLVSLGSLFYEPVWVFYRGKETVERVSDLSGKRIAIGAKGGGTQVLGSAVARDNGLDRDGTTLLEVGGLAAADALIAGQIDAAFYVSAIDGPAVQKLLRADGVRLMNMRRADAHVRRLPFLHKLELPEGVVDLHADIPPAAVTLVTLTGNLVARKDLHPVAIELLLEAARDVHGGPSLLHAAGEFPAPRDSDIPLATDADRFYKERPSFLRRILPFWVAVWMERMLFILLPLAAIAIPAFAYLPKLYDWRIRSKLNGWYAEVNLIEAAALKSSADRQQHLARITEIDERLNRVTVPKSYLADFYTLRQHADYVRGLLESRSRGKSSA